MLENISIMWHQGKQYIPEPTTVGVPGIFKGRPVISLIEVDEVALAGLCPTRAIGVSPASIDMGLCTFCGECAARFPNKVRFTSDYHLASNDRQRLVIVAGEDQRVAMNPGLVRPEVHRLFGLSIKLRQVSAGGDNSCELEMNAANNVQFDMSRYGIDFVASPRHADGLVITGPITRNMAEPLARCYEATPDPKVIILAGTDAISGGIFAGSTALDRSFLLEHHIDLFIPGNPVHPLAFINGMLDLMKKTSV